VRRPPVATTQKTCSEAIQLLSPYQAGISVTCPGDGGGSALAFAVGNDKIRWR
jgi:hypothetical protein